MTAAEVDGAATAADFDRVIERRGTDSTTWHRVALLVDGLARVRAAVGAAGTPAERRSR